jgi:hypothetical protein
MLGDVQLLLLLRRHILLQRVVFQPVERSSTTVSTMAVVLAGGVTTMQHAGLEVHQQRRPRLLFLPTLRCRCSCRLRSLLGVIASGVGSGAHPDAFRRTHGSWLLLLLLLLGLLLLWLLGVVLRTNLRHNIRRGCG